MAQLVCQSEWVHMTRRWTHKARIQERELKLKSRIEVKKPKSLQTPPADTAAKGNGVGKTHSNFLYWWCCAKVDFSPSVICQRKTHKVQFPASNYQSQAFDSPDFPVLSLSGSEAGGASTADRIYVAHRHCKDMRKSRRIAQGISIISPWQVKSQERISFFQGKAQLHWKL